MSWFSHFWSSYHFQLLCTCVLDVSINGSCHQVEQLEHLLRGSILLLLLSSSSPATTTIRFIYSFPVWTTNEKTTHKILQQQQQQREKRKKRRNVVYPGTCPEIDSRLVFDSQLMKNDGLGNVLLLGHMVARPSVRPSPMSLTNNFSMCWETHLASTKTLHTCQSGNCFELVDIYIFLIDQKSSSRFHLMGDATFLLCLVDPLIFFSLRRPFDKFLIKSTRNFVVSNSNFVIGQWFWFCLRLFIGIYLFFFTKCVNGFGGYLLVDVEQFILKFFVTFSFITEKANGIETEEIQWPDVGVWTWWRRQQDWSTWRGTVAKDGMQWGQRRNTIDTHANSSLLTQNSNHFTT